VLTLLTTLALADDVIDAERAINNPDAAALDAKVVYSAQPAHSPTDAKGLRPIQRSDLKLSRPELKRLTEQQVVISKRKLRSFGTAYEDLYHEDLRVFISADSILHAMHRTYDDSLSAVETHALVGEMDQALSQMRAALPTLDGAPPDAIADADLYLSVAQSLLQDAPVQPTAGADPERVAELFQVAQDAEGMIELELFGSKRLVDSSQFTPRGHYTGSLAPYFRAMIWLGRIDLRPVEPIAGEPVFNRRQFDGAALITLSCEGACIAHLDTVDRVVESFVGPPDSIDTTELRAVLGQLGITSPAALSELPDADIEAALSANIPPQLILSHLLSDSNTGTGADRLLPVSFLPMGQRYIVDSYVMSETVYGGVKGKRMMPDPLDVAYAAFGNNTALGLVDTQLYGEALLRTRAYVDAHERDYWESNLYTRWMSAIRALSPDEGGFGRAAPATEIWGRRVLNTQLASWAELRHDTLLYAKQSYTSMALCAFPDAWVEPSPVFWDEVGGYGEHFIATLDGLPLPEPERARLLAPQQQLVRAADILGQMARNQESGDPHTREQMRFVNDAVIRKLEMEGCAENLVEVRGWYPRLFLDPKRSVQRDPTIADVHTQPTDGAGNTVGKVLHVGTGEPRLMVFTVDTCAGPTAFAGPVSSYYEVITKDFERLDDATWSGMLDGASEPALEPWLDPLTER